jgi:hypothetical protein
MTVEQIHRVIGDKLVAEIEELRATIAGLRARVVEADKGAKDERVAVVGWLRDCALDLETTGAEMRLLQDFASCIERGDHC